MNKVRVREAEFKMKTSVMVFVVFFAARTLLFAAGQSALLLGDQSIWTGLSATFFVLGVCEYVVAHLEEEEK